MHTTKDRKPFSQKCFLAAFAIQFTMFAVLLYLPGMAWGKTISGTLSLPSGQTATRDIDVSVWAYPNTSGFVSHTTYITINQGQSSTTYSLDLPDDATWMIVYQYGYNDYVDRGYYAGAAGTSWTKTEAVTLSSSTTHTDIDLTLLAGKTISGQVSLPAGYTDPETPIQVIIIADIIWPDGSIEDGGFCFEYLSSNTHVADYSLKVPDVPGFSLKMSYLLFLGPNQLIQVGYYSTTGTKPDSKDATLLAGGQDWTGIDMELLLKATSSWNLFLPAILNAARNR